MKGTSDYRTAEFGPLKNKTFAGALSAFFEKECPHLGGERIRKVLVQSIVDIVERFYPRTTHLRPGQTPWVTVDRNEGSAYGKKMTETKMTSVILDLVTPQDADDRINGKRTRQIRKEALGRLCKQAYEQGGCLTCSELCILLKSPRTEITNLIRDWEKENQEVLPRRGTIHDIGPSVTHKKKIIEKLFLQGKSTEDVMRETSHSADAVHRYIVAFKQVVLCRKKGLHKGETAFAVNMSVRLVEEYERLIEEFSQRNPAFEESLAARLEELSQTRKEDVK
jgi:hypothetical protein